MMSPDPDKVTWFVMVWFEKLQLVNMFQEWEDVVLDCLENLDGLKKHIFRSLSHDFLRAPGNQTKGEDLPNMIS